MSGAFTVFVDGWIHYHLRGASLAEARKLWVADPRIVSPIDGLRAALIIGLMVEDIVVIAPNYLNSCWLIGLTISLEIACTVPMGFSHMFGVRKVRHCVVKHLVQWVWEV